MELCNRQVGGLITTRCLGDVAMPARALYTPEALSCKFGDAGPGCDSGAASKAYEASDEESCQC